MAARELFAVVPERVLGDARVPAAARALVEAGLAADDLAEAAVVGILAALSLRQLRSGEDTDRIPGDPVIFVRHALGVGPAVAEKVVKAMTVGGLLEAADDGLRLKGYMDIYAKVFERRAADAKRKREDRHDDQEGRSKGRPADVRGMSGGRSDASAHEAVSRKPESESTSTTASTAPPPPAAPGGHSLPTLPHFQHTPSESNGTAPKRKATRRSLSPFVARVLEILSMKDITLSGRGGCSRTAWEREIRQFEGKATDQEVADAIVAAGGLAKPWEALAPLRRRLSGIDGRGRPAATDPAGKGRDFASIGTRIDARRSA